MAFDLKKLYETAERYYAATGFKLKLYQFVAIIWIFALLSAIFSYLIVQAIPTGMGNQGILALSAFAAVMSLVVGIPFYMRSRRIDQIEENLPDSLKHMAAVLKSGGTVESALEEVADANYGPISTDLEGALHQLREGKAFDDALYFAASNTGSDLFKRCTVIILDARKAGAGLADVILSIAEDARELLRIKRERVSRTTMHTSFLYITSLILGPFIFGFTISIVRFIGNNMAAAMEGVSVNFSGLDFLLIVFIVAQAGLSAMAIGVISEGKASKKLLYVPFMVLIALAVYQTGSFLGNLVIGGG